MPPCHTVHIWALLMLNATDCLSPVSGFEECQAATNMNFFLGDHLTWMILRSLMRMSLTPVTEQTIKWTQDFHG